MVAALEDGLSAWLEQLSAVPSNHPVACLLIGLAWIACLLVRSAFAASIATLLGILALAMLVPLETDVTRWAMLAVVLIAIAMVALHIWTWRSAARRELDAIRGELDRVRRAYEGEVHWRMAAYRHEAERLAESELPIADLSDRVEMLARQLSASKPAPGKVQPHHAQPHQSQSHQVKSRHAEPNQAKPEPARQQPQQPPALQEPAQPARKAQQHRVVVKGQSPRVTVKGAAAPSGITPPVRSLDTDLAPREPAYRPS